MFAIRLPGSLGSRAASVAANARDGFRAARYIVRELTTVDDPASERRQGRLPPPAWLLPADVPADLIVGFIAQNARIADKVMNWSQDAASALLEPDRHAEETPTADAGFFESAQFNAYFYAAAHALLRRHAKPPFLLLENRIDAARRALAAELRSGESDTATMARTLNALVRAAPIVEAGVLHPKSPLAKVQDPNVAVIAVACAGLLCRALGKPTEGMAEDAFLSVVGALIDSRLPMIERLVARNDLAGLEAEFSAIKAMY